MADTKNTHKHAVSQAEKDETIAKKPRLETVANGPGTVPICIPNNNSALLDLMWRTNVLALMPSEEGRLYTCKRDTNLAACFKGLVDHNITSAPVITKQGQKFFNFIETLDIVNFVVDHFKNKGSLADAKNFWSLIQEEENFEKLTVDDVAKWPMTRRRIDSLPLPRNYSLLLATELMVKEKNLHRLAVVDSVEHRRLVSAITQSRIVKFLYENLQVLGERKNKTVAEFPNCLHQVVVISMNSQAYEGFELMAKHEFTGLPVVDDNGLLVGTMSIRDVKGMATDGTLFWRLYQRVWDFMDRIRHDYPSRPHGTLYCTRKDTLETVMKMIIEHGIHRIPVVESDADKKVIGIVALRDVLHGTLLG